MKWLKEIKFAEDIDDNYTKHLMREIGWLKEDE